MLPIGEVERIRKGQTQQNPNNSIGANFTTQFTHRYLGEMPRQNYICSRIRPYDILTNNLWLGVPCHISRPIVEHHVSSKASIPVTLGEKLALEPRKQTIKPPQKPKKPTIGLFRIFLGSFCLGILVWLATGFLVVGVVAMILAGLLLFTKRSRNTSPSSPTTKLSPYLLLHHDQQKFMKDLRLDQKTAVFDGNNIYHFGLDNSMGPTALWSLVNSLRSEGYRIVCFFDANIYFTLRKNSEIKNRRERFSVSILKEVFDLHPQEIYVVPKGKQADSFIIETLLLLPISFVVTNDRFRDSAIMHTYLSKDTGWRKGVEIKNSQLHLFQHKFKRALKI